MRIKVDWATGRREVYNDFCKKNPSINLTYDQWRNIIYSFSEAFRDYVLETGERCKLPSGFGEITINKKKRKKIIVNPNDGKEYINLPIDWVKTREKGKYIYNFNSHTEGYFFGWKWFKNTAKLQNSMLWYFKPSRLSSRLLAYYLKSDSKNQHKYSEWK